MSPVDKQQENMERSGAETDHKDPNARTQGEGADDVPHPCASSAPTIVAAAAAAAAAAAETATPATAAERDSEDNNLLVVVTGGSRGIGKACVESFAKRGARVLFTYCSGAAASRDVEQSFLPAGRVQGRWLDQGDFDSVWAFAAEVDRWREGREVNIVVNNAGLGDATVSAYGGLPPAPAAAAAAAGAAGDGNGLDRPAAGGATAPTSSSFSGSEEYDAARRRADEDLALMRVNSLGPVWVTEALLPMMMPMPLTKNPAGTATSVTAPATPANGKESATPPPAANNSPAHKGGEVRGGGDPWLSSSLEATTKKKKTVLFVGSVGGGSQSVFPGFRVADAMSKAAVAYASKYFAARTRQQRQQTNYKVSSVPAAPAAAAAAAHDPPSSQCDSSETNGDGPPAATAAAATTTADSEFGDPSGDVDFVCLCPGATLTDMFRASTLHKMEAKGPQQLERFLRALPQGRLMLPEEVGEAVYWLCSSPAATMFHGAVIDASAGLAVRPGALTEFSF